MDDEVGPGGQSNKEVTERELKSKQRVGIAMVMVCCLIFGAYARAASIDPAHGPATEQGASEKETSKQLKTMSLEELGTVQVVTESKEPTEIWKTPSAIYVLTGEEIRRSGATNVPDALRLVPGVDVARVNGDRNWVVVIRGLGDQYSKYVQVLIDGRSIYTPLFGGVFWTIDNVMLENIDRIEVLRGPGGTIWGSDAVNGVINIITKDAAETQGTLASTGGGSTDHNTEDVRFGSKAHGWSYREDAFGFFRGAEHHQAGQPDYDGSRLGQIGFRADWNQGHDGVTVKGDAYIAHLGDAQQLSTFSPAATFISYASTNAHGGDLLGRWRRNFADGGDLYLQASWAYDYRIGPNFQETRNTLDVDFLERFKPTKYQQFTYGAGLRFSPSTTTQTDVTLGFSPANKTNALYSGFLQEEVRFIPNKLSVTTGIKLEHNSYTGFEYQPNGRLLFTPGSHSTVWLGVSRAVRIPDRVDDDLNDYQFATNTPVQIWAQIVGNKNLRAERLTAFELGYRTLVGKKLYFDFAGFHNAYHDLIASSALKLVPTPTPPLPPTALLVQEQFLNGIHGNTDGGELGPEWRPTSWWQLRASYSYLHVHLGDQKGFTDTATLTTLHGSSPSSQVMLRSLINLPHRFEFDGLVRYVGELPAQTVPRYTTADIHAGWHDVPVKFLGFQHLDFSIVGQNLLQPHHAEFGISPGPNVGIKRGIYAKLVVWSK
jgi:iron complex outermembrane receptor protein